jgi:tRNA A-37 threonylcarbamoyl transferase component Bud32
MLFLIALSDCGQSVAAVTPRGAAVDTKIADGCRKALQELHEQGCIHGDVRLPHFVVDKESVVRIIDLERATEGQKEDMAEEVKALDDLLKGSEDAECR